MGAFAGSRIDRLVPSRIDRLVCGAFAASRIDRLVPCVLLSRGAAGRKGDETSVQAAEGREILVQQFPIDLHKLFGVGFMYSGASN